MINQNRYPQLFDYLTQLHGLAVTQKEIADHLAVGPSNVSKFLNKKVKAPGTMLTNFIAKYFAEYSKWPQTSQAIGRVLVVADVCYFRNHPIAAQIVNRLSPAINLPTVMNPQPLIVPTTPVRFSTLAVIVVNPQITAPLPLALPKVTQVAIKLHDRFRKKLMPNSSIVVSYRGHLNDKDGKGMVFDHMRIQRITNVSTRVLLPKVNDPLVGDAINGLFKLALEDNPSHAPLLFGYQEENVVIPESLTEPSEQGVIIVPGRVRGVLEEEPIRLAHEFKIIKDALNRGQPIIGICAGSWRVWLQCLSWIKNPSNTNSVQWRNEKDASLVDVRDHNYNGGMLRLNNDGISCGYNKEIHDVVFTHSTLKQICGVERMPVNSVHWKAVNPLSVMSNFRVSAVSAINPDIIINTRQQTLMQPQENSVEAFESIQGCPIMGIQWHPEGYNDKTPHANILHYMAKAGHAYSAKRKMLAQFKTKYPTP